MAEDTEAARLAERKAQQRAYRKRWRQENPDKVAAQKKRYYENHKEARQAAGRESNRLRRQINLEYDRRVAERYRASHPDRIKKLSKSSYWANREKRRAANKAFHVANPEYNRTAYKKRLAADPHMHARQYAAQKERLKIASSKWRKANPEKARAISKKNSHTRRARKLGGRENYTLSELRDLRKRCGSQCGYCGIRAKLTIDHIVPLAKGGSNGIRNIQLICFSCNARKQDTDPIVFAHKIGLLV